MATDKGKSKEPRSLELEKYSIGWICALAESELVAAIAMLDEIHSPLLSQPGSDKNSYTLGSMGKHNVVIACLSEYGTSRAAITAKSMQGTFPCIRFGLMVGVGGGIPSKDNDMRLGDIVISHPDGQGGGVIQYDLGRLEVDGSKRLGTLNKPPPELRNAITRVKATRTFRSEITTLVNETFKDDDDDDDDLVFTYPASTEDILFLATFEHIKDAKTCTSCAENTDAIIGREKRKATHPRIFYGNIGSGNSVMKNADVRDRIAARDNLICFEMEAAGLMDDFPCLVIRGISDYSDSHKNWKWQPYAAAVAAAYAKKLLGLIPPEQVKRMAPIRSE